MPNDVLDQDDIDSLLTEMGDGAGAEEKPAAKDGEKPVDPSMDPAAWGLSDDDLQSSEEASAEAGAPAEDATREVKMEQFDHPAPASSNGVSRSLDFVLDIPLRLTVEVGRARMTIGDLLSLGPGSIVELQKLAGEPLEIFINDKLVARGEAVIVNEKYGIRLTDVISKSERIESLK